MRDYSVDMFVSDEDMKVIEDNSVLSELWDNVVDDFNSSLSEEDENEI
jgi:hypothetical protein